MYIDLPKSRREALITSSDKYFTGKICKQGHIAPRFTIKSTCTECNYLNSKEFRLSHSNSNEWKSRHKKYNINNRKNKERLLWYNAKYRAKKYNLKFNIDIADVIIPNTCPLLNIPIHNGNKKTHDNSPSLDKIIPEKGYIKGNVCVISYAANRLKSNITLEIAKKLVEYMEQNESNST